VKGPTEVGPTDAAACVAGRPPNRLPNEAAAGVSDTAPGRPILDRDTLSRGSVFQPVQPVIQTPLPAAPPFDWAREIQRQHWLMQTRITAGYNFPWSKYKL
jgi:hypothetical protein